LGRWRLTRLSGERENTVLKKMLAEALLKNRVLEFVWEKSCEPGQSPGACESTGCPRAVFRAGDIPKNELVAAARKAGIGENLAKQFIQELVANGHLFTQSVKRLGTRTAVHVSRCQQPATGACV
jgi:hypothetical protein